MMLSNRGVPAVTVVTEPFADLADLVAEGLGVGSNCVVIEHPVGRKTADEISLLAKKVSEIIKQRVDDEELDIRR